MPVMMGFEATATIRHLPDFAAIPIIAVSASVLELYQENSHQFGCDDFLAKPVDTDKLLDLLQKYLNLTWHYALPKDDAVLADDRATMQPDVVPPPQVELEKLIELTRFGNMERLREQASYVQALSPRYIPFAQTIDQLAADYEDEKIMAFVTQFLRPGS